MPVLNPQVVIVDGKSPYPNLSVLFLMLPSARSIEQDPNSEIITELFEVMLNSRRHKEQISCLECVTIPIMKEDTATSYDNIQLVLLMGSLSVRARRKPSKRELCVKGAPPQNAKEMLPGRSRNLLQHFGIVNHMASLHQSLYQNCRFYGIATVQCACYCASTPCALAGLLVTIPISKS